MDNLDDIKFAVSNTSGFIIAFFHSKEDALSFHGDQPEGYKFLDRYEDDFHIDFHTDITSSFDVRG